MVFVRGQYICVAELAYIEPAVYPNRRSRSNAEGERRFRRPARTSHVHTRTKLSALQLQTRQKQASLAWILWILALPSNFLGDDGRRVAQRNNLQADHTATA